MAQQVIGQDTGHHRLAHRNAPNSDTGIVTALCGDLRVFSLPGDGSARRQDRTGGLYGKANHHVLTGGDATQNAACLVGQKVYILAFHPHLVRVFFARKRRSTDAPDAPRPHRRRAFDTVRFPIGAYKEGRVLASGRPCQNQSHVASGEG